MADGTSKVAAEIAAAIHFLLSEEAKLHHRRRADR